MLASFIFRFPDRKFKAKNKCYRQLIKRQQMNAIFSEICFAFPNITGFQADFIYRNFNLFDRQIKKPKGNFNQWAANLPDDIKIKFSN